MKRPVLTGSTLSSITLAYCLRLMAMAAARRTLALLNGALRQLSWTQFMSGSPATLPESST